MHYYVEICRWGSFICTAGCRARFPSLSGLAVWTGEVFVVGVGRGRPPQYKMFTSFSGLHPLDGSDAPAPVTVKTKNISSLKK